MTRLLPLVLLTLLLVACAVEPALAQAKNPFSVGISEGGGGGSGWTGWILAEQALFERQLSGTIRTVKADGGALLTLMGLSLAYGVFHAAGPGHGKAVLASYMVANERALKRGIALSFLAALLQGLVAVCLVGVLSLVLHATAQRMKDAASLVETMSFAGIAVLGLWLVIRKGTALVVLWRSKPVESGQGRPMRLGPMKAVPGLNALPDLAFATPSAAAVPSRFQCVDADAGHAAGCAHCHALDPALLGGVAFNWREAFFTVVAAGSRPCSGAILVLVFALAQGLFTVGVASVAAMSFGTAVTTAGLASLAVVAKGLARKLTRPGSRAGALIASGLELGAALVVFGAGLSLLLGYTAMGGA